MSTEIIPSRNHFEMLARSKGYKYFAKSEHGYYVSSHMEYLWLGYCLATGCSKYD